MKTAKKKSIKRDLIEWGIFIAIISALYLTGLHTPVLGALQGLVLKTGIIQPDLHDESLGQADYDFLLQDADGHTLSFEKFRGKTLFVNLWATWCPPCIAEMPDINNLYNEIAREDIAFVMISLDDNFEKAKTFVVEREFDFPVYTLNSPLPPVFNSRSIPTTYVISPDGKILAKHQGMAKYNTATFKDFLLGLAAGKDQQ